MSPQPAPFSKTPLQSLPTPSECWKSVSMDFVFGLPRDSKRKTGIVVFVDRFSKMMHLAAVSAQVTSEQTARLFVDMVFKHHGIPSDFVADRDPRFTARFWQEVVDCGSSVDGQTERVNRVLVDLLKSPFHNWSDCLPMGEFVINNLVNASSGHTPFFVNAMRHPHLPSVLGAASRAKQDETANAEDVSVQGTDTQRKYAQTGPAANMQRQHNEPRTGQTCCEQNKVFVPGTDTNKKHAQAGPVAHSYDESVQGTDTKKNHAHAGPVATTSDISVPGTDTLNDTERNGDFGSSVMEFVQERQTVIRFVQDAIAAYVDRHKLNADTTQNLPTHATSAFGTSKLAPRFIGPFTALERHDNAYTLDLPSNMRLHSTFYVGRLKPYLQPESPSSGDSSVTRSLASVRSQQCDREALSGLTRLCDLSLHHAQVLLQSSELCALELLKSLHTGVKGRSRMLSPGLSIWRLSTNGALGDA
ncbi:reverse transcriptase [Phytophthora palmivora]|uniref:Reverse transcriptase n=1 Tax=Phytophthora palmivora TaxID=4796 RepID=A0A2P4X3V0_9STRA|nr:reverse transcriptase [Phytophthora palmivora]